jgi:hypothetical protein
VHACDSGPQLLQASVLLLRTCSGESVVQESAITAFIFAFRPNVIFPLP